MSIYCEQTLNDSLKKLCQLNLQFYQAVERGLDNPLDPLFKENK